jgi:general secretion pathway protein F
MMRFEIRAVKSPDGVTALALDAADERDARRQAHAQGYAVLGIRALADSPFGRDRFPLLLFSQELIALLDAGLGLIESLQALSEKHQASGARMVLSKVLDHLYQGNTLSSALELCPAAFPRLYVATVRASEKTGDLTQALSRFIAYQVQIEALRSKLITASIYPVLLILVGGVVTLFLLGYVVPRFSAIYADLGREQPLPSQILLQFGSFLNHHGIFLALLTAGAAVFAVYAFLNREWRDSMLSRLSAMPVLGETLRVVQIARLYRTTGMLLRGGIPAVVALDMVGELLHAGLNARLQRALGEIREGKPLSSAMEAHALTTPVAARLLRVGERTGDMGGIMERIAAFHDDEVAHWVDRSTRLFEPLLMVFIGLIIGVIVLALYMPIFELAGSLQ